jgi:hypothetical protein
MSKYLLFAALATLTSTAVADVVVVNNDQIRSIDCAKDPTVTIAGNNATITLLGTCSNVTLAGNRGKVSGSATLLTVAGNDNTATLHIVDGIAANGNNNTVTYKKSSNPKVPTRVSSPGRGNKVSRVQ